MLLSLAYTYVSLEANSNDTGNLGSREEADGGVENHHPTPEIGSRGHAVPLSGGLVHIICIGCSLWWLLCTLPLLWWCPEPVTPESSGSGRLEGSEEDSNLDPIQADSGLIRTATVKMSDACEVRTHLYSPR